MANDEAYWYKKVALAAYEYMRSEGQNAEPIHKDYLLQLFEVLKERNLLKYD